VPHEEGARTDCQGTVVRPGDDLHAVVSSAPGRTTFCLQQGVFRLSETLMLKEGQRLIGAGSGRSILSGARGVSATRQSPYWVVTGQTSLGTSTLTSATQCSVVSGRDPKGMCIFADQVFLDGVSLWQVGSLGELSSGEFFWDYAANKIYLADDPSGRRLEVSVSSGGVTGGAGVTVQSIVVEKFGNPVATGALAASRGWTIADVEVRLNHGAGIHMGPHTVVRNSYIHHNGQLGIHGGQAICARTKGIVLKDSELAFNNAAGYNSSWEAGATKWTHTDGLIVSGNYVHDNTGSGIWTDGPNIDVLIEGNLVEDNEAPGIVHELGYAAVIRDNVVNRNGFPPVVPGGPWGAGIFIDQSRDTEVYGNLVQDNHAGIVAVQEPPRYDQCGYGALAHVENLYVHDNTVRQLDGTAAGIRLYRESDTSYLQNKNNRFEDNRYYVGDANGRYWDWSGGWGRSTWSEWRRLGHDDAGVLTKI
jgi:hypothetical protein